MATHFIEIENVTVHKLVDFTTFQTRPHFQTESEPSPLLPLQRFNNSANNMSNCTDGCSIRTGYGTNTSDLSCSDWQEAQHALFQLANLCLIVSFLTPSGFRHHAFFLRLIINFGYLFFGLWAGIFVCMPDFLGWNLAFFTVNLSYLIYLGYKMCPARLGHYTEDLYEKMFKPLKVNRNCFQELTRISETYLLTKGTCYAVEGKTKCGVKVSVLLKGRLCVTYQNMYLHSIEGNQFIDSPEYDMFGNCDTEETYQISIMAAEDSFLLTWSVIKLKTYLDTDPFVATVFRNLIGKDISNKLYQIQELLLSNPEYMQSLPSRQSSMVNLRSALVTQNSSTTLYKLNCFGLDLKGWTNNQNHLPERTISHYPVETFESQV